MKYKKLGRTGLDISVIGLGTMTWGLQNTQEDGFAQMDYALEQGINFSIPLKCMRFHPLLKLLVRQKPLLETGLHHV